VATAWAVTASGPRQRLSPGAVGLIDAVTVSAELELFQKSCN